MKKPLNLSIPKPCHEDWKKMTPNEQGKFCKSCAKTVVDFTKKSVQEIQSFFIENQGKKVCGRFQQNQLDTITIEIPEQVLFQQISFSKIFLLALLITMGASLMSCNTDGKKQKINQVIVLDSLVNHKTTEEMKIDSIISSKVDSTFENNKDSAAIKQQNIPPLPPPLKTTGIVLLGEPAITPNKNTEEKDTIEINDEPLVFGMIEETPPKFKKSKAQTNHEIKEEFNKEMVEFINSKLNLKNIRKIVPPGKYRNYAQFSIDSLGKVIDIKTQAQYPIIESEINKVIAELPDFIPATQRHRRVKVKYTIPITFVIE